jgi:hypothetical protein
MALKLAYLYGSKLNSIYTENILTERMLFWSPKSWVHYEISVDNSDWDKTQYVSVDKKDNIKAYFSASHDRSNNKVSNISAMIFDEKSIIAKKDLHTFLYNIYNNPLVRKIEWYVVCGNPAENMYDKIISNIGGNVVGIHKKSVMLRDGKYYDKKYYELMCEKI